MKSGVGTPLFGKSNGFVFIYEIQNPCSSVSIRGLAALLPIAQRPTSF